MDDISKNGVADVNQKPENHNHFRQRDKPQRPYSDLREMLNQKRQAKDDSKFNGPPSEPKYNFLSDPLRDNNEKPEHFGSGRLPPPRNNFEYRGRGRGRARSRASRGFYQSNNNYPPNYKRSDEGKGDLGNQEVLDERKSEDVNKDEHVGKEHSRQFRPFQHRPNYQRRRYDQGAKQESSVQQIDQPEGSEKLQRQEENTRGNYKPRKNFAGRGNQYYRPPHRQNLRYRGHQHKRNLKPLDPVNISVEYSVDTGTRKCTIENKEKKVSCSKEEHLKEKQQCVEVQCEENWDEDTYDETPNANEVDESEIQDDIAENETETNIKERNVNAEKGNSDAEKEIIEKAEEEQENAIEENQDITKTEEEPGDCIEEKQEIMKTEEKEKYVEDKQKIESTKEETVSAVEQKQTLQKTEKEEKKEIKIEEEK